MDIAFFLSKESLYIMSTAIFAAVSCAIIGCFLMLQRKSLIGDSISHSLLAGIGAAFLLTGSKSLFVILTGAAIVGVLTAIISYLIQKYGKLDYDSALGVVFSSFFAIGIILITWSAKNVDLDPNCILFGAIEYLPFDVIKIFDTEIPKGFVSLGILSVLISFLSTIFFKELKLVSFDPALANLMGYKTTIINTCLLIIVSLTVVVSFEAVGSVLIVALLVAPAATARLLTGKLIKLFMLSIMIAVFSAVNGYVLAVIINSSVAGMIAVILGVCFLAALLFSPSQGILLRMYRHALTMTVIMGEDKLADLYRSLIEKGKTRERHINSFSHRVYAWIAEKKLLAKSLIMLDQSKNIILTDLGVQAGERVVRVHRLWETYLAKNFELPLDHLHEPAERVEHFLNANLIDALEGEVNTTVDPHGRIIPHTK